MRRLMSRLDSTNWSLVMGAANAVPSDRDRFAQRYEPVIRAFLAARWRLSGHHERIDDATQEVFLRCFQDQGALHRVDRQHASRFRAYLRGVVNNVASEMERRRRRGPRECSAIDDIEKDQATLSRAFDRAWAEMVTAEAWELVARRLLDKRTGEQRLHVLQLRYIDGLAPREIGSRLGLDPADVYRIIATGRYQFRIALLTIMSGYYPDAEPRVLEDKCRELVELL